MLIFLPQKEIKMTPNVLCVNAQLNRDRARGTSFRAVKKARIYLHKQKMQTMKKSHPAEAVVAEGAEEAVVQGGEVEKDTLRKVEGEEGQGGATQQNHKDGVTKVGGATQQNHKDGVTKVGGATQQNYKDGVTKVGGTTNHPPLLRQQPTFDVLR